MWFIFLLFLAILWDPSPVFPATHPLITVVLPLEAAVFDAQSAAPKKTVDATQDTILSFSAEQRACVFWEFRAPGSRLIEARFLVTSPLLTQNTFVMYLTFLRDGEMLAPRQACRGEMPWHLEGAMSLVSCRFDPPIPLAVRDPLHGSTPLKPMSEQVVHVDVCRAPDNPEDILDGMLHLKGLHLLFEEKDRGLD